MLSRLFPLLLAALLSAASAVRADEAPKAPGKIYAVVFGVHYDEQAKVKALRMVRVVDFRQGNQDATDVEVPERYVTAVRALLESPRYQPKPEDVKPEELFTYFFFDPAQPDRANLDPRPKQR